MRSRSQSSSISGSVPRTVATTTSIVPAISGLVRAKRVVRRSNCIALASAAAWPGSPPESSAMKRESQPAQVALKSKSVPSLSKRRPTTRGAG